MGRGTWKIAVLVAVWAIFAILEYHTAEAQVSSCAQCNINARCSRAVNGYYCICRRGYSGNGYIGSGTSGCRRKRLRAWKVAVSIIGSILGALLLLCLCLACIRKCFVRRRHRGQQGVDPAHSYPQQAAYPQQAGYPPQQASYPPQQGVPMYATNNNKVPGPEGVV